MSTELGRHIERLGLTQIEFARRHRFSPALVCQWVHGKRRPGRDNAARLEQITGIPASYWKHIRRQAAHNKC